MLELLTCSPFISPGGKPVIIPLLPPQTAVNLFYTKYCIILNIILKYKYPFDKMRVLKACASHASHLKYAFKEILF
jgi:hypothetical protein